MNNTIEKSKLIQYRLSENECDALLRELNDATQEINRHRRSKYYMKYVCSYFKILRSVYNTFCISPDPEIINRIDAAILLASTTGLEDLGDNSRLLIINMNILFNRYISTTMMSIQSYYIHHMDYDKSKLDIFNLIDLGCNIYTSPMAYCTDPMYSASPDLTVVTDLKEVTLNKVLGLAHLELSYPKQILIESEFYHDRINNPREFDCSVFNNLPKNIHYVINIINGTKADYGSLFILRRDVDGITHLTYMNNRANISYFAIYNNFSHIAPSMHCNRINGKCKFSKECLGFNSYKLCGFGGECDKFTSKICALVGIMTDYFSSKPDRILSNGNSNHSTETDYKQLFESYSDISIINISAPIINNETMLHHGPIGSDKKPHVREGYFRHLKSGKTVWVNSTVIHKDKYIGPSTGILINKDTVD